jgi:hypothetical protein
MTTAILSGLAILFFALLVGMNLPVLSMRFNIRNEPFQAIMTEGKDAQCGIGFPSCSDGKKCMNGYCKSVDIPVIKGTQLEVVP